MLKMNWLEHQTNKQDKRGLKQKSSPESVSVLHTNIAMTIFFTYKSKLKLTKNPETAPMMLLTKMKMYIFVFAFILNTYLNTYSDNIYYIYMYVYKCMDTDTEP